VRATGPKVDKNQENQELVPPGIAAAENVILVAPAADKMALVLALALLLLGVFAAAAATAFVTFVAVANNTVVEAAARLAFVRAVAAAATAVVVPGAALAANAADDASVDPKYSDKMYDRTVIMIL
jgi:hypothetical protein